MTETHPAEVVAFWRAAGPDKWFLKDEAFDADIKARFFDTYVQAVAGQLSAWENSPEDALALVIVLDQFPRNMFRGTARMFTADSVAREVARRAIARNYDEAVPEQMRGFFYLPFMHSEELADQDYCVTLYRQAGDADGVKWAEIHADIIRRFGRFPHRNSAVGRGTTPDEQAFLDGGGFSG